MKIFTPAKGSLSREVNDDLAIVITKSASKQTYYTFRLLVERRHFLDACRAYAYCRWVDDQLDNGTGTQEEKLAFFDRQLRLLDACYGRESYPVDCAEEQLLVDLIAGDHEQSSGLQIYLHNMMAVMSFDVHRKGRTITQAELNQYTHLLSSAVTELLFYFLAHDDPDSLNAERYQAVYGAHITHMLRDMLEDVVNGYINVPSEILAGRQISPDNLNGPAFREWVVERVGLARSCFTVGRRYFSRVKHLRCRLAAFAYLARFEWMLKTIEHDQYRLRRTYPERKSLGAAIWMIWTVIKYTLKIPMQQDADLPLALPD